MRVIEKIDRFKRVDQLSIVDQKKIIQRIVKALSDNNLLTKENLDNALNSRVYDLEDLIGRVEWEFVFRFLKKILRDLFGKKYLGFLWRNLSIGGIIHTSLKWIMNG